jgi:hypothetical protein
MTPDPVLRQRVAGRQVDALPKHVSVAWGDDEDPSILAMDDEEVRTCRECGCTDDDACEGGCEWVEDDLCSRCAPGLEGDGR